MFHETQPTRRSFLGAGLFACTAGSPRIFAGSAAVPGKGPWQLGCFTRPWDQFDYRVALDGIAEAGFQYAGILTHKGKTWLVITPETTAAEAREVGEEIRKRGLTAISVYSDFQPQGETAKSIADLRRLIDHCAACGSPNLLLGGTTDPKQYAAYYKTIAACCDFAADRRVGLSIKPHGGQNATGRDCRKAIELVNHPGFRLWYDPGNILYYSQGKLDPVLDAADVDGLVVGMSIKDYRSPDAVLFTPGTGRVDFKNVLARLRQGGFSQGPLVVECLTTGTTKRITDEARKSHQWLMEILAPRP